MPLPLLPGLVKTADDDAQDLHTEEADGLTQFLDGLGEDEILGLVAEADEYHAAKPDPAVDPDADPEDVNEAAEGETEGTEAEPDAADTEPAQPMDYGEDTPDEGDGSGSIDDGTGVVCH